MKTAKYFRAVKKLLDLSEIDKERYSVEFLKTLQEFGISRSQLYNAIKKLREGKDPRTRKPRSDRGRTRTLTGDEIASIERLINEGKSAAQIYKVFKESGTSPAQNLLRQAVELLLADNFAEVTEKGMRLKWKNKFYTLPPEDVADLSLILHNAMNRAFAASGSDDKLPADRARQRKAMLLHLIETQMQIAASSSDYKHIEALTRMLQRIDQDNTVITGDFDTLLKVVNHIRPDISRQEIIDIIKTVAVK